jgi:hypothetical protein
MGVTSLDLSEAVNGIEDEGFDSPKACAGDSPLLASTHPEAGYCKSCIRNSGYCTVHFGSRMESTASTS